MPLKTTIENLDRNFSQAQADGQFLWHDALAIGLRGQGWRREHLEHPCDRLPLWAKEKVTPAIWTLSHHSAGLSVDFITNAERIAVRWSLRDANLAMVHMPATGVSGVDLYLEHQGVLRSASVGRPTSATRNESVLVENMSPEERRARLYLPLYNGIESLSIGVPVGADLRAAPADLLPPIVFWGTSITHGGCASRPGMSYPAILGRRLARPHVNLGFSGNSNLRLESAELLATIDAAVYCLDPLPNVTPQEARDQVADFIVRLRELRPETPIIMVESVIRENSPWDAAIRQSVESKNLWVRQRCDQLRQQGLRQFHYVQGPVLLGDDGEATVDGIHPSDLGFFRIADALEPVLRQAMAGSSSAG